MQKHAENNTGDGKLTLKGARRRSEILEASAVLFDRLGYHSATIAMIAQEIGSTKANVYHYFRAKHDILFAIHDAWIDELLGLFDVNVETSPDVESMIRQVFHDLLFVIHSRTSQVRVYFEFLRELPEPLRAQAVVKRDAYQARVENVVRRGMSEGVIREQPLRIATLGLFGMANWSYQWYRPEGPQTHEQVAEQLFDAYWHGVLRS